MAEVIDGMDRILRTLDLIEPKLKRQTMARLRKVAGHAAVWARASYPSNEQVPSGFSYVNKSGRAPVGRVKARAFPRYDQSLARDGVKVTTRKGRAKIKNLNGSRYGFVNLIGLTLNDAAGAIMETAGTKNPLGRSASGAQFIRGIAAATGVGVPLYKVVLPKIIDSRQDVTDIAHDAEKMITRAGA